MSSHSSSPLNAASAGRGLSSPIDLGVDPNKSTPCSRLGYPKSSRVDFAWRRRPAVEFRMTSDFSLALLQVDLNRLESLNNSQCWPKYRHRRLAGVNFCMLSSILMAIMQSVDSFLYLGSLYSHLTVIVGQRLCATLGSHHHHHHHYISSDVSSEQRRPWVQYNISAITKKYRE